MKAALKLLSLFWLGIMCIVLIFWGVKSFRDYQTMKDVEKHLTMDFQRMGYKGKCDSQKTTIDRQVYGETMDFNYKEKIEWKTFDLLR